MERDMNENEPEMRFYVSFPPSDDPAVIVARVGDAVLVAPIDTPPPSDGDLSGWTEIGYTTEEQS
jgi:hypothetical protein